MTPILPASPANIRRAAALLCRGQLIGFGTETVYGLGADATNAAAVAAIFAAKNRPSFNPLICHFPSAEAAWRHVVPNADALRLAAAFWPGPLTLVLPRRADSSIASLAAAGLPTLAVRVPASSPARAFLAACGRPVAAPSANLSGRISPSRATDVLDVPGLAAILDCGPCQVGLESTVLALTGPPLILRPGGVTTDAIGTVLGYAPGTSPDPSTSSDIRAPGMLTSHYAPHVPVRLNANQAAPHEALLAFGPAVPAAAGAVFNLSPSGDLTEAASRLFAGLRALDASGMAAIAVMPVPETGLGVAINDRLRRAAAPRPTANADQPIV